MPSSTNFFKKETTDYILKNHNKNVKILDVGAGTGVYSDILKKLGYLNIDCVEVFEPYINDYRLKEKYDHVFLGDVCELDLDFNQYDLIILGDVLEHIDSKKAKVLLSKILNSDCIVAVPFQSSQGEHFGNKYEIHLQEDLTPDLFTERFDGFVPLCLRFDYGVFVKKNTGVVYLETEEKPFPDTYENYLKIKYPFLVKKDISGNLSSSVESEVFTNQSKTTIVTALFNLGRDNISQSFKRNYSDYLQKFGELLRCDSNMYIFADESDEEFIWTIRKKHNTVVKRMSLDELKNWFEFTNLTNEIRKKEKWLSQAGWLRESPQATLEGYNPLVMSKMFMLNNVTIWNQFNSEYFFWVDAGLTSTVHYGYFSHDKVLNNLEKAFSKTKDFIFLTYPYEGAEEIHGFERNSMARYCNTDYVRYVCRGGFFGGKKETINQLNGLYYGYLKNSLSEGLMGTEESIFTILMHNHGDIISQFMIEGNGLVWPFFEELKSGDLTKKIKNNVSKKMDMTKVGLYVISFNSPQQFRTLIESFISYDKNYLDKPTKFLLDNSTDLSTTEEYKNICIEYGFEHIKKENLGICGGRQWISEHFESTELDYYLFFEDDMFFYPNKGTTCKNGFARHIDGLYEKSLEIIHKEKLDFIKLNYTEFYGDNGTQWSWYNVPQPVREEFWPKNKKLPEIGLDPNAPETKFEKILSYKGVPYAKGEVYYCNWPQIVSKEGNRKMFLDTKWAHPYEQTWMSHIYQLTKKGEISSGLLLMTPTEHNRFEHYEKGLRKES